MRSIDIPGADEETLQQQFSCLLAEISGTKVIEENLPVLPPIISDSFIPTQSMAVVGLSYAGFAAEIFEDGGVRSDSPHVHDEYYVKSELLNCLVELMRGTDSKWDEIYPERDLTAGEISRLFSPLGYRATSDSRRLKEIN